MASLPKKVTDRFNKTVGKFQKVLEIAKDRDVNESDTVAIITDMLGEVFGYDKYLDITSELAVRGTYCDLAIKIDDKIQFLIEVKAIGMNLKENHLTQAVNYGANMGIPWVILTNGIKWNIYKLRFEKPIDHDLVCSFDFLKISSRADKDQNNLFILTKEGLKKNARSDYYEKTQNVNRFIVSAIILNDAVLNTIRRELRKLSPNTKVDTDEIASLLKNEVLKRDVIEGDESVKTRAQVSRFYKKSKSKTKQKKTAISDKNIKDNISISNQLLKSVEDNSTDEEL